MPTDIPNKMARGVSNKVDGHFKRYIVYLRKSPKVYLIEWPLMHTQVYLLKWPQVYLMQVYQIK